MNEPRYMLCIGSMTTWRTRSKYGSLDNSVYRVACSVMNFSRAYFDCSLRYASPFRRCSSSVLCGNTAKISDGALIYYRAILTVSFKRIRGLEISLSDFAHGTELRARDGAISCDLVCCRFVTYKGHERDTKQSACTIMYQ